MLIIKNEKGALDNDLLGIRKIITSRDKYSEDIDLVQIKEGPIKPILKRIDEVITFFEEARVVKVKANNNTLLYRFNSEYPHRVKNES